MCIYRIVGYVVNDKNEIELIDVNEECNKKIEYVFIEDNPKDSPF